jgi:Fanconi anemia group M protein
MSNVVHPYIVSDTVEERSYQTNIVAGCLRNNTLIILPTGLGKTIIALRVAVEYVDKGKILILAPTKPLLEQHQDTFSNLMVGRTVCVVNGSVTPKKRVEAIAGHDVIIATPQTISNDLKQGRYTLDGFSLVIYDEAHRAVGDYAYVTIAEFCDRSIRSIGMTASPGFNINKIREVCQNISMRCIDYRSEDDRDVAPYVHDTYVIEVRVNLPDDLIAIDQLLKEQLDKYVAELTKLGFMNRNRPPTRGHLLDVQRMLQLRLSNGERRAAIFKGLALTAKGIKILHAMRLAETQGITPLRLYLDKLEEEAGMDQGGRSAKELVGHQEYIDMRKIVDSTNVEHPKVSKAMSIVSRILADDPGSKVMVFTELRDTCDMMVGKLSAISGAHVAKLVGQAKEGMKQREQEEVLEKLRSGDVNVIVATSVGEEGLDISSTNAVIFYEPVPSEIRTIQRRGRTGRKNDGDVYVLIASGTMDEGIEAAAKRKEQMMRSNLDKLNYELSRGKPLIPDTSQNYLDDYQD